MIGKGGIVIKKKCFSGICAVLIAVLLLSVCMTGAAAVQAEPGGTDFGTVDSSTGLYAACRETAGALDASQILVYDATDDRILFTKTVDGGKLYPASITKLFTACVAMEYLEPSEVLTAGDELTLVQADSSKAYIYQGQRITAEMAVEAMMLPSGNDAALIAAAAAGRRIAGDDTLPGERAVETFVAEMNRQARELGFEKTHFANPDGYHVGCHYTCVNDMARIAKAALNNPTVSKYIRVAADDVIYASGQNNHWDNTNLLLRPDSGFYRADATGMKTGRTSQAGYCLMSAFRVKDSILVIGIFGCKTDNERFQGAIALLEACREHWNER